MFSINGPTGCDDGTSTGAVISYYYSVVTDAYNNKALWLNSRGTGGAGGSWTYLLQVVSTCSSGQVGCQQKTTTQNSIGDYTTTTFTLDNGAWPTQVLSYDHTGNLLSTVTNTWDFSQSCPLQGCAGHAYIRKLSETSTTYIPSGGSLTKKTAYAYDSPQMGNITSVKEWKFYPGTSPTFPSTPDRATYLTYYYLTGATQNNINRPLNITVCNNSGSDSDCPGGGSKVSQTKITYDSYGSNGLSLVTGVANHDDANFGTGNTARGNPTLIQNWVSGSTFLNTQLSYDTTGQVIQKIDPKGYTTSFSYADNFFTETGAASMSAYTPSVPTNAYLTNVTPPSVGGNNFVSHFGYYFGRGERAVSTDVNNLSDYAYYWDPMDRPTQTSHPIGWNLISYTSPNQADTYVPVNDTSASVSCTSCRHNQFNYDTLGRKVNQNLANAPGGAINVDTTYDFENRVQTVSHPYINQSARVLEYYSYDGLGRTTQVTHPDSQFSQIKYGSFAGSVTQQGSAATYGYGYPIFRADEAGKEILQWIDGFGRVIEVDEPSQSSNTPGHGTVTISGVEGSTDYRYQCGQNQWCDMTIWDAGYVTITVDGFQASTNYNQTTNTTSSALAASLASSLNTPGSPVTATANGSVITLTANVPGAQTNYTLSASATTTMSQYFSKSVYSTSTSGATLTGGTGGISVSPNVTLYAYDAANRLTQVVQGVQTRTHLYDGLGRLLSTQTPEASNTPPSGQQPQQCPVTFTYDNNGNVLTRTAPAPNQTSCTTTVTTTYGYDALNRVTGKTYSNGAGAVTYTYDVGGQAAHALGRMTSMTDPSGSEAYTYDLVGRITQVQKVIGTTTFPINYQLYVNGQWQQVTYPSTRVVQQNIDSVGRPTGVTSGGVNYTSGIGYNPAGQVTGFNYGNGVVATFVYSPDRSQMTSLSYVSGSTTLFSANYGYKNGQANCGSGTITGNDGLIQCIQDLVDNGRSVVYGYDGLNRLVSATTTGSSGYSKWGYSWAYDRYGNRTAQTITAGSGYSNVLSFGTLPGGTGAYTNRPDGYAFDGGGNMLNDGVNTLTFDAENRALTATNGGLAGAYTYDDHGTRVVKVSGGTTTAYVFAGSKDIAEYDNGAAPGSPSREYIYSGGVLVATLSGTSTIYHHADHLSVRVSTDASGNKLGEQGHYPYGEQWYATNTTTKFFFTTYERDGESGLDYAMARLYVNRFGRFCSADPILGQPSDPQSWNRYAYVRNNPVNLTDPRGQDFVKWFVQTMISAIERIILGAATGGFGAAAIPALTPPIFEDGTFSRTIITNTYHPFGNHDRLAVISESGGFGTVSASSSSEPASEKPDIDRNDLRLEREFDCQDANGRHSDYQLVSLSRKKLPDFTVSEHHTAKSLDPGFGYPNEFPDDLRPAEINGYTVKSTQTFTLTLGKGYDTNNTGIPVMVRIDNKDYDKLVIFMSTIKTGPVMNFTVLVNGKPSSDQRVGTDLGPCRQ